MVRRTTLEIDGDLLDRAKRALGCDTMRATVEVALQRAADAAELDRADRAHRQADYFRYLHEHADMDVLASEEMWR